MVWILARLASDRLKLRRQPVVNQDKLFSPKGATDV